MGQTEHRVVFQVHLLKRDVSENGIALGVTRAMLLATLTIVLLLLQHRGRDDLVGLASLVGRAVLQRADELRHLPDFVEYILFTVLDRRLLPVPLRLGSVVHRFNPVTFLLSHRRRACRRLKCGVDVSDFNCFSRRFCVGFARRCFNIVIVTAVASHAVRGVRPLAERQKP